MLERKKQLVKLFEKCEKSRQHFKGRHKILKNGQTHPVILEFFSGSAQPKENSLPLNVNEVLSPTISYQRRWCQSILIHSTTCLYCGTVRLLFYLGIILLLQRDDDKNKKIFVIILRRAIFSYQIIQFSRFIIPGYYCAMSLLYINENSAAKILGTNFDKVGKIVRSNVVYIHYLTNIYFGFVVALNNNGETTQCLSCLYV